MNESMRIDTTENVEQVQLKGPFLIDKHMQRDSMAFEFFSLANTHNEKDKKSQNILGTSKIDNNIGDESMMFSRQSTNILDQSVDIDNSMLGGNINHTDTTMNSLISGAVTRTDTTKEILQEKEINKQYRLMCEKPKRLLVKFYTKLNEKETEEQGAPSAEKEANISDISFIDKIKEMAEMSKEHCSSADCDKPRVKHTDYYYHANGCVKIGQDEVDDIRGDYKALIYCHCVRCNQMIIAQKEIPSEVLEMSFYKLLEQFFYNQDIVSLQADDIVHRNANRIKCRHSFHKDAALIIRYGCIKITMKYEQLDCFSLDLIHFANEQGAIPQKTIDEQIGTEQKAVFANFQTSMNFVIDWTVILQNWLELGMPLIHPKVVVHQISGEMNNLIDGVKEYLINFKKTAELQLDKTMPSIMQLNRLKQLLSTRMCEILYLIQGITKQFDTEFVPELPKNYQVVKTEIKEKISLQREEKDNLTTVANSGMILTSNGLSGFENDDIRDQASSMYVKATNEEKIERPSSNKQRFKSTNQEIKEPLTLEDMTEEIKDFRRILANFQALNDLMQVSPAIPLGFNQNGSKPDPKDIGSLIATVLNSNLYHNGLLAIDYMNMGGKMRPYTRQSIDKEASQAEQKFELERKALTAAFSNYEEGDLQMEMDPQQDVFNGKNVTVQQCEAEMVRDKSYLFDFFYSTQDAPEMVIIMAKDIGDNKNSMAKGENFVDPELTSMANKKREYFSQVDQHGQTIKNTNKYIPEIKILQTASCGDFYSQLNVIIARHKFTKQQYQQNQKLSKTKLSKGVFPLDELNQSIVASEANDVIVETSRATIGGGDVGTSQDFFKGMLTSTDEGPENPSHTSVRHGQTIVGDEANQMKSSMYAAKGKQTHMPQSVKLNENEKYRIKDAHNVIYHTFNEKFFFQCRLYFPGKFEALRKLYCGSYESVLQSIMKSKVWSDNSGGKSNSTFYKTEDEKYVFKKVRSSEIKMFGEMSNSWFEYISRSFVNQCPTAIAKVLGIFELTIVTYPNEKKLQQKSEINVKLHSNIRSQFAQGGVSGKPERSETTKIDESQEPNGKTKTRQHIYILMMENLLLGVDELAIQYDLKGSRRNRYVKTGKVQLDNNFLQDMKSRPIPMQYQMKRMLQIAINNDSLYLAKHSIIDYSLFVAINPITKTVRVGIIDYIQQYTFKKILESTVKQLGATEDPTILPPEPYKKRFRLAMDKYFIALVPDKNANLQAIIDQMLKQAKVKQELANKQ